MKCHEEERNIKYSDTFWSRFPSTGAGGKPSMLGPAVNCQPGFRRGLVEQSNAEKNNPVGCLAGCLARWLAGSLPGCLAAWLPGCLAALLLAGWMPVSLGCLAG